MNAHRLSTLVPRRTLSVAGMLGLSLLLGAPFVVHAGRGFGGGAVGGVRIDVDGVIGNVSDLDLANIVQARREALNRAEEDLGRRSELRKVSLRRLIKEIQRIHEEQRGLPLPDEIRFLAGLQRIRYIFVYPDEGDIVLAGPAAGWKVDERGDAVSEADGAPVLKLDDFLIAFRSAESSRSSGMSCSIDPTAEGIQRLNEYLKKQKTFEPAVQKAIESSLGNQKITITGVPAESGFAQVLLVADYRMKRYAMGLEKSPVKGVPSYLQLLRQTSVKPNTDLAPRWWMAADYAPLLTDGQGLAWELRPGVKCLSEDELRQADGTVRGTGKTNPVAKKWADAFTANYAALAAKDTIFADLRNCIDLAVAAALIVKEGLAQKAGLDLSLLADSRTLVAESFVTPKYAPTEVSLAKKQREWLITASGGVQFNGWRIIERSEKSDRLTPVRGGAKSPAARWWWD